MKPVLIDRSLVEMKFEDINSHFNEKRAISSYAEALIEAGAAYVEIDYQTLMRLPKPNGAENYIFRIGARDEYIVANALSFSYAIVPLRFHDITPRLNLPAILELNIGDNDVFDVLQYATGVADISAYSMIRLVGEFDPDTLAAMIVKYKRRTIIPIDICPTNDSLSALTAAISAYIANADAITVSFGEYERFASLEELLIMLSAMHKIVVSRTYLTGICKASIFMSMFAEKIVSNLAVMIRRYMYRPMHIENIDSPKDTENLVVRRTSIGRGRKPQSLRPAARVLNSMGLERSMSEAIMEILDVCQVDISGIIKNTEDEENKQ
jgi:hypothetical protein